jgi:Flp pilus assembly protein TadB
VAQTRRRRRTKHRGNAAGVIESRGRTGRKPTAAEKRGDASAARKKDALKDRRDRPPTWRGAFYRAMVAAVLLLVLAIVLHVGAAVAYFPFALLVYTPISYYTDLWIYRRRQRTKAGPAGGRSRKA